MSGDVVLLNLPDSSTRQLEGGSVGIWTAMDVPCTTTHLIETLAARFECQPEAITIQVETTLRELERIGAVMRDG